jgi:hypothetical protein
MGTWIRDFDLGLLKTEKMKSPVIYWCNLCTRGADLSSLQRHTRGEQMILRTPESDGFRVLWPLQTIEIAVLQD